MKMLNICKRYISTNNKTTNKKRVIPFLAKPFININSCNGDDNPFWLSDKHVKQSNLLFNSKIVAYPVYVAQTIHKYKPNTFPQIAIFGKSNVGKSSLINALLSYRPVAQTSNTPGRTRQLFIFELVNHISIADLPGYGFAKVSKDLRDSWSILIEEYLNRAKNLKRVLCLIDCEQLFTTYDFVLLDMLIIKRIPFQIVLTKIDKLKASELHNLMVKILSIVNNYKKKVEQYNTNEMKTNQTNDTKGKVLYIKEPYEFKINEYIHAVSSLKYFGIEELRANLYLIVQDYKKMQIKSKK